MLEEVLLPQLGLVTHEPLPSERLLGGSCLRIGWMVEQGLKRRKSFLWRTGGPQPTLHLLRLSIGTIRLTWASC